MNMRFSPARNQHGAALIVGLLLLLVLTLISLSALKNTTRQQVMTTNSEISLQTFGAAESAIRDLLNEVNFLRASPDGSSYVLRQAITNSEAGQAGPARQLNGIDEMTITSSLTYMGTAPAPGSTLNLGTGQGFVMHQFMIDGRATMGETTDPLSRSWHQQGLAQLGPG